MGSVNDVQFYPAAEEPIGNFYHPFKIFQNLTLVASMASDKVVYLGEIQKTYWTTAVQHLQNCRLPLSPTCAPHKTKK